MNDFFTNIKLQTQSAYEEILKSPLSLALIAIIIISIFPLSSNDIFKYHEIIIVSALSVLYSLYFKKLMTEKFKLLFVSSFMFLLFMRGFLPILLMINFNPGALAFGLIMGLASPTPKSELFSPLFNEIVLRFIYLYASLFIFNLAIKVLITSKSKILNAIFKPFTEFAKNPLYVTICLFVVLLYPFIFGSFSSTSGKFALTGPAGKDCKVLGSPIVMQDGNIFGLRFGNKFFTYNPSSGEYEKEGDLKTELYQPKAVLLKNGEILILGQTLYKWQHTNPREDKNLEEPGEIYNPKTNEVTLIDKNLFPNSETAITELPNGNLLLAGGYTYATKAQIYNFKTKTFTKINDMNVKRTSPKSILLDDGNVFILGANDYTLKGPKFVNEPTANNAEIYNPKTGKFSMVPIGFNIKSVNNLIKLNDGRIFIYGEKKYSSYKLSGNGVRVGSVGEGVYYPGAYLGIYNPKTQKFQDLKLNTQYIMQDFQMREFSSIQDFTTSLLKDGRVLITGGRVNGKKINYAEIFDPKTNKFMSVRNKMKKARENHSAITLKNGNVLLMGGSYQNKDSESQMELFIP